MGILQYIINLADIFVLDSKEGRNFAIEQVPLDWRVDILQLDGLDCYWLLVQIAESSNSENGYPNIPDQWPLAPPVCSSRTRSFRSV